MSGILGCYQRADRWKLVYVMIGQMRGRDPGAGTVWSHNDTAAESLLRCPRELT